MICFFLPGWSELSFFVVVSDWKFEITSLQLRLAASMRCLEMGENRPKTDLFEGDQRFEEVKTTNNTINNTSKYEKKSFAF